MDICPAHRLAQNLGVWRFAPDQPFVHPFVHHGGGDVAVKLFVKQGDQPPDLGPVHRRAVDHRGLVDGFLDIFAYRHAINQQDVALGMFHDRRPAGRVH